VGVQGCLVRGGGGGGGGGSCLRFISSFVVLVLLRRPRPVLHGSHRVAWCGCCCADAAAPSRCRATHWLSAAVVVSRQFLAFNWSPCLRPCVHGASIGSGGGDADAGSEDGYASSDGSMDSGGTYESAASRAAAAAAVPDVSPSRLAHTVGVISAGGLQDDMFTPLLLGGGGACAGVSASSSSSAYTGP
jgi:hypothetical protein